MLIRENDEEKRKKLTAKLKVYKEDEKIKVRSNVLIGLG
jgi:hypothetical protein